MQPSGHCVDGVGRGGQGTLGGGALEKPVIPPAARRAHVSPRNSSTGGQEQRGGFAAKGRGLWLWLWAWDGNGMAAQATQRGLPLHNYPQNLNHSSFPCLAHLLALAAVQQHISFPAGRAGAVHRCVGPWAAWGRLQAILAPSFGVPLPHILKVVAAVQALNAAAVGVAALGAVAGAVVASALSQCGEV